MPPRQAAVLCPRLGGPVNKRPFGGIAGKALSDKPGWTWQISGGQGLSHGELTPFSERGSVVLLEDFTAIEVAVWIEVVVDRGVDGGEFLEGLDIPEARHCPFSSSERLV